MNPSEALQSFSKISVIGLSPNEDRPSYYVTEHMIHAGYEITGVNPAHDNILGLKVYPKIESVPAPLEIVAVFRSSEYLMEIVQDLIPLHPKVLWIQLGITDPAAEERAESAGIIVIRQRCLMVEEEKLQPGQKRRIVVSKK